MKDFVIIGTGPSAFFLTKTLLEQNPDTDITLLEAGKNTTNPDHPLSDRLSNNQEFRLKPSVNIGYGGTSQLWHNVLAPLDEEDFEYKSWIPLSGWPIKKSNLEKHYKKTANFFNFEYDIFDNPQKYINYFNEINKVKFDSNVIDHKVLIHPKKYLRTNIEFDKLLKKYKNVKVLKQSVALNFVYENGCNVLNFFDSKNKKYRKIHGRKFILCAGALNNPEILFNSLHLSNNLPMLGKCLMDHPMGNFYQFRYKKPMTAKIYQSLIFKKNIAIKTALRLSNNQRSVLKLANSVFYLQPSFSEGYNNETEKLKLKLLTVRDKLKNFKIPFSEILGIIKNFNMVAQILQYKTGMLSTHKITDCMFVTEQRPSLNSYIALSGSKNEYGNKKTEIFWNLDKEDLDEVNNAYSYIRDNLMKENDAHETYNSENYSWEDRLSSAAHHLGTVRMSDDYKNGCVDKDLKIHGSENIYVCDGSVFSSSGNANPTFTCMALASRLGEHLNEA